MTSACPPAAVLFDVGDTLLVEQRFDLEAGLAAVVPQSDAIPALAKAFRARVRVCQKTHEELQLASWLQRRLPSLSGARVEEIEDRIWHEVVTLSPSPGVIDVLQQLARDGVPMAAISNAAFSGRVLLAELSRHGLGHFFRFVLSSADLGVRKPAPKIFEVALERLAVPSAQAWFVGDTFDEDVAGALNAGLTVFWLSQTEGVHPLPMGCHVLRSWSEFLTVYDQVAEKPTRLS
jgi:HAD superfamily hydrolase (TIGR01549 family)